MESSILPGCSKSKSRVWGVCPCEGLLGSTTKAPSLYEIRRPREAMVQRKIIGFHQDEAQEWVADLEWGHKQHVRHTPPWLKRPWVVSPEGRRSRLRYTLDCKHGDHGAHESAPPR